MLVIRVQIRWTIRSTRWKFVIGHWKREPLLKILQEGRKTIQLKIIENHRKPKINNFELDHFFALLKGFLSPVLAIEVYTLKIIPFFSDFICFHLQSMFFFFLIFARQLLKCKNSQGDTFLCNSPQRDEDLSAILNAITF